MANIILGSIVGDIRGSVSTETYIRGPAGLAVRSRVSPAQPPSALRDQAQLNLTNVSREWSGGLTALQRKAWEVYASSYPLPNVWGNRLLNSGYLAFVRSNLAAKTLNPATWQRDPPNRCPLPIPSFTFTATDQVTYIDVDITVDSHVPREAYDNLIVSAGKATNVGVNYYSSPWRVIHFSYWTGSAWNPPLSSISCTTWAGTGQRIFLEAYLFSGSTGALSRRARETSEVT